MHYISSSRGSELQTSQFLTNELVNGRRRQTAAETERVAARLFVVFEKLLGIFTWGHALYRVLDRKRNIKTDFFVTDY
jgi:hypothetical protein